MGKAVNASGEIARLADHRAMVDLDIVDALETALAAAKRGEYASMFWFGMLRDQSCNTFFSKSANVFLDLGHLDWLRHRIITKMAEE